MNNNIIFYGSFPPKKCVSFGGGEEGNQRTVNILKSAGFNVHVARKLRSKSSASNFQKKMTYPFRMAIGIVEFFFALLMGNRDSIVHISGFCGHTILNEFILLKIAKTLRHFTVFELRGGGADKFYDKGTSSYKKMFKWIITNADYIFSQGMENKLFLGSFSDRHFFYYPNYIERDFRPSTLPNKPKDAINLIFFGRVEQEKNVLMIIDIAATLQEKFHNISLTIIGNGKHEYIRKVKKCLERKLQKDTFIFIPGCKHNELSKHLIDKHFYIFPSQQEYEGHSNSVTEAMAYGIIPIVSTQGFSRSIVGNDKLVIDDLSIKSYAERISNIINQKEMQRLSTFVFRRVNENYTEEIVGERLIKTYQSLFIKTSN